MLCYLLRKILIALVCVIFLVTVIYAHPGGTDASGGHHDRDTGQYHYHHGYEAHQHYDMDGDGDVDCPYNFDDQTGRNSGTSSGSTIETQYSSYWEWKEDQSPSSSSGSSSSWSGAQREHETRPATVPTDASNTKQNESPSENKSTASHSPDKPSLELNGLPPYAIVLLLLIFVAIILLPTILGIDVLRASANNVTKKKLSQCFYQS